MVSGSSNNIQAISIVCLHALEVRSQLCISSAEFGPRIPTGVNRRSVPRNHVIQRAGSSHVRGQDFDCRSSRAVSGADLRREQSVLFRTSVVCTVASGKFAPTLSKAVPFSSHSPIEKQCQLGLNSNHYFAATGRIGGLDQDRRESC